MSAGRSDFNLDKIALGLRAAGYRGLVRYAEDVADQMRQNIGRPGHGVPSAPGEFPRKQSGETQGSIRTVEREAENRVDVVVGGAGPYLEGGTPKMAARPFILRTFQAMARRGIRGGTDR
jgi:hypothetical protein